MIALSAMMTAKPGHEAELEAALRSVIPLVENEAGTLQYVLHRSIKDAGKFFFYEQYADREAMNLHSTTPYLKELFAKLGGLLAEKPTIQLYEPIAAIPPKQG